MHRRSSRSCREDQKPVMDDQRDLISNNEQLPMLGRRPGAPESKCSRGALYTGFSILVTLLLAGQATTAYFLYQQQGRLDKLTVTSQNLQLENLRMKLPKPHAECHQVWQHDRGPCDAPAPGECRELAGWPCLPTQDLGQAELQGLYTWLVADFQHVLSGLANTRMTLKCYM
uniref:CD74 molecule n=1 Tax=Nomascus leucogenys TaxID=61853 RepID=A0A2I3I088_NOMLE